MPRPMPTSRGSRGRRLAVAWKPERAARFSVSHKVSPLSPPRGSAFVETTITMSSCIVCTPARTPTTSALFADDARCIVDHDLSGSLGVRTQPAVVRRICLGRHRRYLANNWRVNAWVTCCDTMSHSRRCIDSGPMSLPSVLHPASAHFTRTFWPTRAFVRVDLPAFGTPTMPTCSNRCWSSESGAAGPGGPSRLSTGDATCAAAREKARTRRGHNKRIDLANMEGRWLGTRSRGLTHADCIRRHEVSGAASVGVSVPGGAKQGTPHAICPFVYANV